VSLLLLTIYIKNNRFIYKRFVVTKTWLRSLIISDDAQTNQSRVSPDNDTEIVYHRMPPSTARRRCAARHCAAWLLLLSSPLLLSAAPLRDRALGEEETSNRVGGASNPGVGAEVTAGGWVNANDLPTAQLGELPTVTHRAWFDVSIGGEAVGRLVFGLFGDAVPRTVEHFAAMASCELEGGSKPLCLRGSQLQRMIPGFMAKGSVSGTGGGNGLWGGTFADENSILKHTLAGTLSMVPNTAHFYITFRKQPQLDGKHVVFGQLESGFDTLKRIEAVGTLKGETWLTRAVIQDSGVEWAGHMGSPDSELHS